MRRLHNAAFTLIELLVVLTIAGILIVLLMPAVQAAREAARRTQCKNHLKQMGLALHNYHAAMGVFPPGYVCADASDHQNSAPGWGWAAMLLPQLDQSPLYNACNFDLSVNDPANTTVARSRLELFMCPSDTRAGACDVIDDAMAIRAAQFATNSYAANFGSWGDIGEEPDLSTGLFGRNSRVRVQDVIDGTNSTVAIGERVAALTQAPWIGAVPFGLAQITAGAPVYSNDEEDAAVHTLAHVGSFSLCDVESGPDHFFSLHKQGAHFLMTDGSVRFLESTIHLDVLHALSTRAGGEPIDGTQF